MLKAIMSHGEIRPLEPLPADWQEGQRLRVEKIDDAEVPVDEIIRDFAALRPCVRPAIPRTRRSWTGLCRKHATRPRTRFVGKWGSPDGRLSPDCNHFSAAIRKVSPVRDRIHAVQGRPSFHLLLRVICELEAGIQQTPKVEDNRRRLAQLCDTFDRGRLMAILPECTARFSLNRCQGRVLSQVDMMLAAPVRQHGTIILTTDRDFEALPDLRAKNRV